MWKNHQARFYEKFTDIVNTFLLYLHFFFDCFYLILYSIYAYPSHVLTTLIPFRCKSFKEEVILITGSASGIGRELCLRIAKIERCCTLVLWDINDNDSLVEELKCLGVKKILSHKIDVSDYAQVKACAEIIKKQCGTVTLLINNAAIGSNIPLWKHTETEISRIIDVNLKSNFWTLKEFLPGMIIKNKGHIVTMCSMLGQVHSKNASVYCASKFGVLGAIESVKEDIRSICCGKNIHFTTVFPQFVSTPLVSGTAFVCKYPFLMPKLEPAEAAKRIVDGVRIYQENIYLPFSTKFTILYNQLSLPSVLRKSLDLMEYDVVSSNGEQLSSYPHATD